MRSALGSVDRAVLVGYLEEGRAACLAAVALDAAVGQVSVAAPDGTLVATASAKLEDA